MANAWSLRAAPSLLGVALVSAQAFAQTPPLPPLPPPPPGGAQQNGPQGGQIPPQRRPVKGNMNGLLDYMADVGVTDYEEIDSPAVGYGNELLWEKQKTALDAPDASPTTETKRQARKKRTSNGNK